MAAALIGTLWAQSQENTKITVAGIVVNAVSGEPIPGALVTANLMRRFVPGQERPPQAFSQRAVTDASGRFSFEAGGAVNGSLQVSRAGYYSENNLDRAFVVVGNDSTNMTVRLLPANVITGRVLTSDGEPIPGITVEAVKMEIANGRREFRESYANATTDDRGEYRLWNIAPGSYYVKAAGRASMNMFVAGNAAFGLLEEAYVPVYYPSAISRQDAQLIPLKGGQNVNASFSLEARAAYQIRGKIANLPHQRALGIRLLRTGDPLANRTAVNVAAETFQVADVIPGSYTLQIYTSDALPKMAAEVPVTVENRDLTGVSVALAPGVDLHGTIENAAGFQGEPLVHLHRLDEGAPPGTQVDPFPMPEQGGFSVRGLLPGRYEVSVDGFGFSVGPSTQGADDQEPATIGPTEYVSGVRSGNVDVLSEGLTVTPGGAPDLIVTLTPGGGTINLEVEGLPSGQTGFPVSIPTTTPRGFQVLSGGWATRPPIALKQLT